MIRIKLLCFLILILVTSCIHSSDSRNIARLKDEAKGYIGNNHGKVVYEIIDSQEKLKSENIANLRISNVWLEFSDSFNKVSLSEVAINEISQLYRRYIIFCLSDKQQKSVSLERDSKITKEIDELDQFLLSEEILSPEGQRFLSEKERGRIIDFVIKKAVERCNSDLR